MIFYRKTGRILRALLSHDAAQQKRLGPLLRFLGWQLLKRSGSGPVIVEAFQGGRLKCYPENSASNAVIYFDLPDWAEMQFLQQLLRPGDGFLDIGANVGVYSVLANTLVQSSGSVLAFEPDPKNAEYLNENFLLNAMDTQNIHKVVLGDKGGTCRFDTGQGSTGSVLANEDKRGETMEVKRLDTLVDDPSAFMVAKVDVEGFELPVLHGATRLLEAKSPKVWLVETNRCCEQYGMSRLDLKEFFAAYDFEMFAVVQRGQALRRLLSQGPFPDNSLAVGDLEWVRRRIPTLAIEE
jgi:FkbM family methyltransferase